MAKISLIISLLVLIGTAGLGFKTKGMVEEKIAELTTTKLNLRTTTDNLTATKKELKTTSDNLVEANKTVDTQKGQIASLEGDLTTAKAAAEKAEAATKEQETLVASLNEQLVKLKNPAPGALVEKTPAMIALETERDQAVAKAKELEVARDAMQQRQKVAEENLVAATKRIQHYENPIMQQGLSGRVLRVNNGYNFVVVNVGDRQGVTVNSPLLVTRNGQLVAKLKITSVEPGLSIGDVVGGTMAKGDFVQPGDRVVFAGMRANPTAPLPPEAAGPSAGLPTGAGGSGAQ